MLIGAAIVGAVLLFPSIKRSVGAIQDTAAGAASFVEGVSIPAQELGSGVKKTGSLVGSAINWYFESGPTPTGMVNKIKKNYAQARADIAEYL